MSSIPLIFLHGFPFNASAWDPQIEHLKSRENVFAPDLRGHGQAPAPAGPWMISHFVADLKKFMTDKGISKAVLYGLSMGGYVALQFVLKYPENVAGLILCDTRADADSNEVKEKRFETIERLRREGAAGFASDFSKQVLSETTLRQHPNLREMVERMILSNGVENMAMVLGALASRWDSRSSLSTIKCPTLVLVGADDKVTPPELSELIAGGIEDAKLRIIERAGHLSNLEQPDLFNEQLDEFLNHNFSHRERAAAVET